MINTRVIDLTENTLANVRRQKPDSADQVRASPMLAAFSPSIRSQADALKSFLLENLYRHYRVMRLPTKARTIVRELFEIGRPHVSTPVTNSHLVSRLPLEKNYLAHEVRLETTYPQVPH